MEYEVRLGHAVKVLVAGEGSAVLARRVTAQLQGALSEEHFARPDLRAVSAEDLRALRTLVEEDVPGLRRRAALAAQPPAAPRPPLDVSDMLAADAEDVPGSLSEMQHETADSLLLAQETADPNLT